MVYRYRRGRYNRRKGIYRRKGYTMYKLYRNRSSGAQARQIYGLNKKLKSIERKTRPEINIAPLVQGTLSSDIDGTVVNGVRIFQRIALTNLENVNEAHQDGFQAIEGRFARLQNVTLKGMFTYVDPRTENSDYADVQRMAAFARVVLIQTKTARSTAPSYNDIFTLTTEGTLRTPDSESPDPLTEYAMIRAPLAIGAGRVGKVLSDKTYMINDTHQVQTIKTKLKYIKNWYQAPNEAGPKGMIYMYVMIYNQNMGISASPNATRFDYISKCVYTDA